MARPLYRPKNDRESHITGLKQLVAHILTFDGLSEYKREAIDRLLWNITEIDGKYRTRYRSEGALFIDRQEDRRSRPPGQRLLQHEHVYTRSWLLRQLVERPGETSTILDLAIGCVVTRDEHAKLRAVRDQEGWARYRSAGIRVYDLASEPPSVLAETVDASKPAPPAPPTTPSTTINRVSPADGLEEAGQTRALSLKAAYAFGAEHGLAREVEQIRTMEIRWDSSYTSSVRRGFIVELFQKHGIFDEFKAKCWAHGSTPDGEAKTRRYLRIKNEFEQRGERA